MNTIRSTGLTRFIAVILFGVLTLVAASHAGAQATVGDRIKLKAFSNLGVPLHRELGERSVSGRLADGTTATVDAIDQDTGWLEITAGASSGWITKRYVGEILPPQSPTPSDLPSYVVGSWNLEHFHDGAKRGFPENTRGGPSYPARTQSDYEAIAAIIEEIEARILVLEEVYARNVQINGEMRVRSAEVERLIAILGTDNFDYAIGGSGASQHIAILYDTRYVRLNAVGECAFPPLSASDKKKYKKELFARQPLLAHFSFLHEGTVMNDLVVVGVHLASGQRLTKNHDKAMRLLEAELKRARDEEWCIPSDERDILIAGDFNASRFDNYKEDFWDTMEGHGWDVLADNADTYSPTRLKGNPLTLGSTIDYIVISAGGHGLAGEEVTAPQATVHSGLVGDNPTQFRKVASDHIPVTVSVRVMEDTDESD